MSNGIDSKESDGASVLFSTDAESMVLFNGRFTVVESLLKLLTRDLGFADFTREVLLVGMHAIKSEAGSLLEVDHANNSLFFRAVVGQSSDSVANFSVPMGQGVAGHVAESRQAIVVDNAEDSQMHLKQIAKAVGFEARNLVAVPIVVRGRIYGVLELLNRVGEENFTSSDLDLLNYFCEMAARALEVRFMIAGAVDAQDASQTTSDATRGNEAA